jgi:hypothetical protein
MTQSHQKQPIRWFVQFAAIYVLGNVGAFYLSKYLVNLSLRLIYLIPLIFLIVPVCGLIIWRKGRPFDNNSRSQDSARGLLTLYILTWLAVVYVFLMNIFPEVF